MTGGSYTKDRKVLNPVVNISVNDNAWKSSIKKGFTNKKVFEEKLYEYFTKVKKWIPEENSKEEFRVPYLEYSDVWDAFNIVMLPLVQ